MPLELDLLILAYALTGLIGGIVIVPILHFLFSRQGSRPRA